MFFSRMTPVQSLFEQEFDFIIKQTQEKKLSPNPSHKLSKQSVKNQLQQHQHQPQSRDFQVAQIFFPLILLSKWLGYCPLKIARNSEKRIVIYKFNYFSLPFLATTLYGFFNLAQMILWTLNSYLDIDKPFRL